MIRAESLTYRTIDWLSNTEKKDKTILEGISLGIPSGQFVVILGPNGSGKSTFAKHLNALLLPSEGTVLIDGKSTAVTEELSSIRRLVGMVFQNPDNQIIGSSVEEDVAFGLEVHGEEPKEIDARITDALAVTGMTDWRFSSIQKLSGGQKQRVAISGVLAGKPACLVLDEPTAMLDTASRYALMDVLSTLNRANGITIVLITHHADEAAYGHRILAIQGGHAVFDGSPADFFNNPALVTSLKMELPQVCELAHCLHAAGLPLTMAVLREEELVRQLMAFYKKKKETAAL